MTPTTPTATTAPNHNSDEWVQVRAIVPRSTPTQVAVAVQSDLNALEARIRRLQECLFILAIGTGIVAAAFIVTLFLLVTKGVL